jgi:hypothetical protein
MDIRNNSHPPIIPNINKIKRDKREKDGRMGGWRTNTCSKSNKTG